MSDKETPSEPPGAVSDQNQEEAPHEDREYGLRRLRSVDTDGEQSEKDEGAAGEGSQSTGNPDSAG
jgi:hypothetical protein